MPRLPYNYNEHMAACYPEMKAIDPDQGCKVNVVYVLKRNAKAAKSALEAAKFLNKNFRMIPATNDDCIAVPVSDTFDSTKDGLWKEFVEKSGSQVCPYSTAVLGSRRQFTQTSNSHLELTLVQQAILRTVQAVSSGTTLEYATEDFIDRIEKLDPSVCPKKLEIFGDDRTLVVPPHSFEGEEFQSLLCINYEDDHDSCMTEFWRQLAKVYNSPRVARRGTVDPNSKIRESGHRLLFPNTNKGIPEMTGPGSPGWIRVTEQGINQSFDITRVMFSRGNISEKIRFGKLVKEGDKLLDMYAGIGYYTLPALIHGCASYVYACEWNEHAANALRYNIKDNRLEDRVTVLVGDCRVSSEENNLVDMFDRVSLGLLPSSEGGWRTAVRALKNVSGGWLHIHGNVSVKEVHTWAFWLCDKLLRLCKEEDKPEQWIVLCGHVEKVKSFAPTVSHYVADVFLGFPENHPHANEMQGTKAGVLSRGQFSQCPDNIQVPSCALSPDGVLSQEWMR
jgi:tRNA G37 N-methylase Trm5